MILFSRCAFLLLLSVTTGCQNPTSPASSTIIDGNRVRLTTSASAREVAAGTPVVLRITLTNEGAEAVTLHFRAGCQILPYLRRSRGEFAIPSGGGYICTAALTQLSLAPGESRVREHVWTGSTAFQSEMPLVPLARGRYYFTAEVPADEATLRSEPIELILK